MKTLTYIVSVMVLFFSCSQEEKLPPPISSVPLTVEIKGRIVPKDSMELPIIIPAGQPAKVDAVNTTVFYPQSNVYPAGSPSVVPVGSPKVSTPGRNGLPLPQVDTATFSDGRPATPEISTAKEAYQKDHNPHNFSTFSKLQGLKSNLVSS